MAFLLVDRILSLDPGLGAQGCFSVPKGMSACPAFLLAEAVGQLASWVAMEKLDFLLRPVAALAGQVDALGEAVAGDVVELSTHLDRIERGGVLYGGAAAVNGRPLLRMIRCVGPLLPMEEFDDPAAVRAHFLQLRESGLPAGGLLPVLHPEFETIGEDPGRSLRVSLEVPRHAPFFAEHFPRKAVYPATILLDRKNHVAQRLLRDDRAPWRLCRALHLKMSAFTLPGERLEIEAVRVGDTTDEAAVQITGYRDGSRVSRVRMEFVRDES